MNLKQIQTGNTSGKFERGKYIGRSKPTPEKPYSSVLHEITELEYTGTFEVYIDQDRINKMIDKAARNSNKKCKAGGILIKVKTKETVLSVKRPTDQLDETDPRIPSPEVKG